MWWMLPIIILIIFVLFYAGYKDHLNESKKQYQQNGKQKSPGVTNRTLQKMKNYLRSESFRKIVIEVCSVFLGAILAIQFTMWDDNAKTKARVQDAFRIAVRDIETQSRIIAELIERYDKQELDVESLRINVSPDLSLIERMLYNDDIIIILNNGSYSMLLNNYRSVQSFADYLKSNRLAKDDYIVEVCHKLSLHMEYLAEELNMIIRWKMNGEINEKVYRQWFSEHAEKVLSDIAVDHLQ